LLKIRVETTGGVVTLRLAGRLVRGSETALLCAAIQRQERQILLDLSATTAIDAAGIGALVSLLAAGKYLVLENPPRVIRDTLQLTGLDSIFEISEPVLPGATVAIHTPPSFS
jgi:anti-anti-sigma factor